MSSIQHPRVEVMTPDLAALVREARDLVGAPVDDPRRADYAARKAETVRQIQDNEKAPSATRR